MNSGKADNSIYANVKESFMSMNEVIQAFGAIPNRYIFDMISNMQDDNGHTLLINTVKIATSNTNAFAITKEQMFELFELYLDLGCSLYRAKSLTLQEMHS